jgi:TRAP-type C4-dicarboxylate transport system permease small subunit
LLRQKLDGPGRRRLDRVTDLFCGSFAIAVLIVGGLSLVRLTWQLQQTTAVLGIPMAWVYIALPLSGGLITWFAVVSLLAGGQEAGQ